jgi:hypothetical protein
MRKIALSPARMCAILRSAIPRGRASDVATLPASAAIVRASERERESEGEMEGGGRWMTAPNRSVCRWTRGSGYYLGRERLAGPPARIDKVTSRAPDELPVKRGIGRFLGFGEGLRGGGDGGAAGPRANCGLPARKTDLEDERRRQLP